MSLQRINIRNANAAQRFSITLDGTVYQLAVRHNGRTDSWYLDIANANGTAILTGVKLVTNFDLLGQYRAVAAALPPGILFCADLEARDRDPGRGELGLSIRLYYQEAGQ